MFSDINHSNIFLAQSPKAKEMKVNINQWDLIKLTMFCTAKATINKQKKRTTWEKILVTYITNKGPITLKCKELLKKENKD